MFKLPLMVLLVIVGATASAQHRLVGTVSDSETGAYLAGGSIKFENVKWGVTTDDDGRFALNIPTIQVKLVVSRMGYHPLDTVISITPGTPVAFFLIPKPNIVEEVLVSTGYQTLPKERLTGSFEVVSEKLFDRQISQDVISRLDGLVPGMLYDKRFGNNMAFRVRGLSTISPTIAQPLIIVDDFPYEGDIQNINPNDVETVTILKDAAAASIWGVRAGNGVVVITTKKGKLDKPFSISANVNFSTQDKPNLFYTPQMTPSDFIDIEQFLFSQGAYDADLANRVTYPVITPGVEIMERKRQGAITELQAQILLDELRERDIRRDLIEYVYQRPLAQQYSLSLGGGNGQIGYLISGGLDRSIGDKVGNDYERITLRMQSTFKPVSKVDMTAAIFYTHSQRDNNALGDLRTGTTGTIYPYARLVDDVGQPAIIEQQYRLGFVDTAGQGQLLDWYYRPLEEAGLADHSIGVKDLVVNLSAKYEFIPQLNAEVRYQYQHQATNDRNHHSEETFYTRNLINRFTQISGSNVIRPVPLGGILQMTQNNRYSHNFRGQFAYTGEWTPMHRFIVLVGGEVRRSPSWSHSITAYGYDDELMLSMPIDQVNRYPIYGGIGFASPLAQPSSFTGLESRFVSVFANASYTLHQNHVFTASARRDASNLFGVATNDKWKPLWSAGYRWNISESSFLQVPWTDRLSLRVTYGHSGNVNNTIAAVTTIDYRGLSTLAREPYALIVNPPQRELTMGKCGYD